MRQNPGNSPASVGRQEVVMRIHRRQQLGLFAVTLALAALAFAAGAAAQEKTWDAHITDEMCGSSHMMEGMTDPECARACQEMGSALALYVAAEDMVYKVADQEQVQPFAGTDVRVTGTVSEDGKSVTISSIEAR